MRIEAGEAELAASTAEVAVIDKRIERTDTKLADAVPLVDANTKTIKVESITAAN